MFANPMDPSWEWKNNGGSFYTPVNQQSNWNSQLSNEKNPGWLGYIGDYTTQLYRDYNKPL